MKWEMEKSIISRRNIFCLERYRLNIVGLVKYFDRLINSDGKKSDRKMSRKTQNRRVAIVAM